jgi:alkanesulfonate monooxygenase SsuD/methylene tetrahydromethanopterin reductase-like flavin-dependent oxidoreductase (luciferase family)
VKRFRLGVRLGERKPKIVLAALGERMLRLAGEVADGVLLNYAPASHVPWSVERVREGGGARIYAYVHAGVADRETSLEPARRDLFSYAVADAYARSFTAAGFGDEVAEVRARHQAGDREGAVGAISQAMVDAIDFTGTPDEVGAFVRSYAEAGVDEPVLMPLPWGKDRMAITLDTMRAAAG